jgi:energy-coupling factor transport system ATP-binding protein
MIEVHGLVHRLTLFGSRPDAPNDVLLNGVDLSLERGEIVLFMGRNGSGKTTVVRYMAGLLIPQEGTVTIDEFQTHKTGELREIRRRVGLLFQESHEQIIAQTLIEDVAFGLENIALPAEVIEQRAWAALDRVGLSARAGDTIEVLTPAERQRLALAGLLAMDPAYYILDEPDRTADHQGLALLLSLVRELRVQKKGIFVVSHKEFWSEHVDRVMRLERGKAYSQRHSPWLTSAPSLPSALFSSEGGSYRDKESWSVESGVRANRFHLQARDLSFTYEKSDTPALKNFSAEVTAGEFIIVTGPEGSGKSTLVELLAGLVQPISGCVLWNGTPLISLRAAERVRCVGLVFQEARQQLLGESVKEEILLGVHAQRNSAQVEQRACWACEAVGLDWERFQEQPSHLLSGGEQARVAIAALMALDPRVLILDETLSSLDPHGQVELLKVLQGLHAGGTTVLLVTAEDHAHLGTRLWKLDRGQLIYDGSPERE